MSAVASSIAESIQGWLRWRAGKRSTPLGWLTVFAAQGAIGLLLFLGAATLLGAPLGLPVLYCAFFFAVGCGLSGVVFGFVWSFIFIQLVSLAFGLSVGVWFGSPSWWESAAQAWASGTTIPKLVVVAGLLIPPIWCASCALLHRVWFKGWQMGIGKILSFFSGEQKDDSRRKEAVRKLDVSDQEAERALRQSDVEPEGLAVIGKSKVVRAEQEEAGEEEDESPESRYASLEIGTEAEELAGLDQAAAKSKQKVDASGAVIADDGADDAQIAPTKAEPVKAPVVEQASPVKAGPPAQDVLRGEDRNRLQFLAEEYNLGMQTASDENPALLDFMEQHTSALLGMSDKDIAFLRSLPDDFGLGLAHAALEIQAGVPETDTFFKSAVEKGMEELDAENIERPTASVPLEDEFSVSASESGNDAVAENEGSAEAENDQGFSADFSFSGDSASRASTGRRVASLLSQAASMERTEIAGSVNEDDEPSSSLGSLIVEDEPEDEPASEEASSPVAPAASIDPVMRRMELMGQGLSASESKAQVEREIEELEKAAELAASITPEPEPEADAETDVVSDASPETEAAQDSDSSVPVEGDGASEALEDTLKNNDEDAQVTETPGESEFGGFVVSEDDETDAAEVSESEEMGPTDVDAALNDGNGDEMVEAVVSELQARRIYSCMTDHGKSPREKFEGLMAIEREEGAINTITAVRSNLFSEFYSEKVAHEVRNAVLSLIRDFKDDAIVRFGETASEAEAKILELNQAPHKIDRARLDDLDMLVSELEGHLKDDQPTQHSTDRKIRLTSIRAEIGRLKDSFAAQSSPKRKVASARPSDGQRALAKSMVNSLSGEETVSVVAADQDEAVENAIDTENDVEIDLASVAAEQEGDEEQMSDEFADKPWLDPELGDLDEEYPIVPEGLDINTDEGAETMRKRADVHARRVRAKKARDIFMEAERAANEAKEREEQERIAKSVRIADVEQREESVRESEAEIARRSHAIEEEKTRIQQEKEALEQERRKMGERTKVLDDLSSVFGQDVGKKVEAVQFLHQNMLGFFEIRQVPQRFAQVEGQFMDLALSKAIQKRVKGSSVSLQEVFGKENGEDLPERLFPHKSIVTFHGATIFRKAAEIIHKLAVELEVDVEVPQSEDSQTDANALIEKCGSDEEREFVQEIVAWLNTSRSEYFQLHHAVEENAEDFREARRAESSDVHDVEVLMKANTDMKSDLEKANESLAEARAEVKRLEEKLRSRPVGGSASTDDPDKAEKALEMFEAEDFRRSRGKASFEVGGRRVVLGIFDNAEQGPDRKKAINEMSANRSIPFVVFTDVNVENRQDFEEILDLVSVSFQPLDLEEIGNFIEEEVRKINNE